MSDDDDRTQHPAAADGRPTATTRTVWTAAGVVIISASPAPTRQVAGAPRRGL